MPIKANVKRFSRSKIPEPDPEPNVETETEPEPEPENVYIDDDVTENIIQENDDFLNDLNNENYVEPPTQNEMKEQEKQMKEIKKMQEKQQREMMKEMKNKEKKEVRFHNLLESNNDLFSDIPTEIIGKEKRELINKITQYRNLFPKELAKFKVKKNCNVEELKAYLKEAESIVECSSVDGFITDSILQSIKLTEAVSKRTKYDISGCADMLKSNPKFHSLLKQLYCKYGCFNKIPVEMQLLIMVSTTSYMCLNKNKNKAHFEQYLNEPMQSS